MKIFSIWRNSVQMEKLKLDKCRVGNVFSFNSYFLRWSDFFFKFCKTSLLKIAKCARIFKIFADDL